MKEMKQNQKKKEFTQKNEVNWLVPSRRMFTNVIRIYFNKHTVRLLSCQITNDSQPNNNALRLKSSHIKTDINIIYRNGNARNSAHTLSFSHTHRDTHNLHFQCLRFLHFLFIDLFSFLFRLSFLNVNQMDGRRRHKTHTHILRDRERMYERTAFKSLGVVMRESE